MSQTAAVRETLHVSLDLSIGGQLAEQVVGSQATQNHAPAKVYAEAHAETRIGYQFPQDQPMIYCPKPGENGVGYKCYEGEVYNVDCEADGGSEIHSKSYHSVVYTSGANKATTLDDTKQCFPGAGGGGGGGGSDSTTWIIEQSDDGGQTWYEIGRFTTCT
jgi:hypothetical protein